MQDLLATNRLQRLFESGLVCLEQTDNLPVEIKRGMVIQAQDGQKAARVAAVVFSSDCQKITHLLLTLWSQPSDYRLAPVILIMQVDKETILLGLDRKDMEQLPHRQEENNEII